MEKLNMTFNDYQLWTTLSSLETVELSRAVICNRRTALSPDWSSKAEFQRQNQTTEGLTRFE
jgi:hypothetical protein